MLGAPHTHSGPTAPLSAVAACLDRLAALGALPPETLQDLRHKIESERFDLVVVGQFKRGKTSLVNALIGAELLPVAVVPLTSVVTALSYGPRPSASVVLESGATREIPLAELSEYVTERRNPDNRKGVREAHVTYPARWLEGGVRLIDTPGVGSVYQRNTDVAHRFLPKADAVLFLLSVDQPISRAECDFLASVREHAAKIYFVLNKIDLLSEPELDESIAFTREALTGVLGAAPRLFALSARLALVESRDGQRASRSGMPELARALRDLLTREKSTLLAGSVARQARRAMALARFELQLEHESLTTPLAELDRKAALFRAQKEKILLIRDEFDVLLGSDAGRVLQRPLEDDLQAFAGELKRQAVARLEQRFGDRKGLGLRQLYRDLENSAIDEIRGAFDEWRAAKSAAIDQAFEAFCARHAARIEALIDELFRFASDLFAIPFAPRSAGAFYRSQSHFQYKFWSEPPALRVIGSSLVLALPRALGGRLVLERVRRFALESVETQTGRLRYDFSQRLDTAVTDFRQEMDRAILDAVAGIEAALGKAHELKSAGEAAGTARLTAIAAMMRALDEVDQDIARIAEDRGGEGSPAGVASDRSASAEPAAASSGR